ncbi:MAG: FixH family protein [Xanthomonadales bacterium]|nr:FixH family protein [Xanthomonadales bacterium]MBK7145113.1 FixH family protein [Xanthomonadales bacterium]MCC6561198.1 FixH family protein [Xanthomonadales bacterium]
MHAWYRQPVMWIAIALPAISVLAGVGLAITAHGGLDVSPDPVRRVAQVQISDQGADRRALELGLHAELELAAAAVVVQFAAGNTPPATNALLLIAVHATDSGQDRRIPLSSCGADRYCADSAPGNARFDLVLADAGGTWRIVGVRELGQQRVALAPAWSAPR